MHSNGLLGRSAFLLGLLATSALLALHGRALLAHSLATLRFPYPLDYGEGPLLQQAGLLAGGLPLARLYGDPAQPPFLIVNYPPLSLLLTSWLGGTGDALLAGRLLSLLAALACAGALYLLLRRAGVGPLGSLALALSFLALPATRQWATLLRVDLLGVALGLWALVALPRDSSDAALQRGNRWFWCSLLLTACLLIASLYTKPSLVAAPLAACWLLARRPVAGLALVALLALGGGGLFWLLQRASGGWFAFHVISANANRWEAALAWQFWREQLLLLWPLFAAALLGSLALLRQPNRTLPLLYTLGALVTAIGVGKVGAYANYFLELYAALLWLCAGLLVAPTATAKPALGPLAALVPLALAGSLLRYYPLWDQVHPRQAGMLSPNPPRLVFGTYGLSHDTRREQQLLGVFRATNGALIAELHGGAQPVLTDTPGLVVAAGATPRMAAFEYRQLIDQGLLDQGPLLRELANGELPLALLDYLGNWLPPKAVTIIRHRYAMDGSVSTTSRYRPIALGPAAAPAEPLAGNGYTLVGYRLAPLPGEQAFGAGQIVPLGLDWRRDEQDAPCPELLIELHGPASVVTTLSEPLLYDALTPAHWPVGTTLQHLAAVPVPPDTPAGSYELRVGLRDEEGAVIAEPRVIARLRIGSGGRVFENGTYVPAGILAAWGAQGGMEAHGAGLPMMPAVPFATGTLQCFERACFDLGPSGTTRRSLGTIMALEAGLWPVAGLPAGSEQPANVATGQRLADAFTPLWASLGPELLGEPTSPPLLRNGHQVQYTSYARIELTDEGVLSLGRVGDDYLRRLPGMPYGWPAAE